MDTSAAKGPLGRPFWSLCGAGLASSIGDGAVFVGFPILAATLTRDPRLLAGVAVAQRLPWLLLSLVTGALADRLDRRRMIACVEILRMVAVGLLALAVAVEFHPLAAIYVAAFTLGSLETAFTGASSAVVPELVGPQNIGRSNGYLYAAQMSGEGIVGPATGGLLAAAALSLPFLFDSATFAASAALLLVMLPGAADRHAALPSPALVASPALVPSPEVVPARRARVLAGVLDGVAGEVREGLRWFLADPAVRLVAGFIAALAFCQAAVFSVLVLWAERYLHVSRAGYGLLLTLAALGVVTAALLTGRTMHRFPPARLMLAAGAVAGGAYVALGSIHSFPLAAAVLLIEGAAVSAGNVVSFALRQTLIPPELLGRVGNAMRTCIFGAMPAGALAGGLLASTFGLREMFALAGVAQLVAVAAVWRPLTTAVRRCAGGLWPAPSPASAPDPDPDPDPAPAAMAAPGRGAGPGPDHLAERQPDPPRALAQ